MQKFRQFLLEVKSGNYNDEHAHANIWNHMVKKGISHDRDAMHKEFERSKSDPNHTLHPSKNAHGWTSGKVGSLDSYYKEHEKAIDSIHHLVKNHSEVSAAAKEHAKMSVAGGTTGKMSFLSRAHYGTYSKSSRQQKILAASTSKSDLLIHHGDKPIGLSLKTGTSSEPKSVSRGEVKAATTTSSVRLGKTSSRAKKNRSGILTLRKSGHVLMSGGPEETISSYHHATRSALSHLSRDEYRKHRNYIMQHVRKAADHLEAMRNEKVGDTKSLKARAAQAQAHIDHIHKKYPELQNHLEHEATYGAGKFRKDDVAKPNIVLTTRK